MYSKSEWTSQNGTMSDKSARKEFGLTQQEIMQSIRSGKLQYRGNNAHGNSYFKLIRKEVEKFVREKYGENKLKKMEVEKKLRDINRELNSAKRKVTILEKRKAELINLENDDER